MPLYSLLSFRQYTHRLTGALIPAFTFISSPSQVFDSFYLTDNLTAFGLSGHLSPYLLYISPYEREILLMIIVIFIKHFVCRLNIPLIFFKNFSHKLVQITYLTFIAALLKIRDKYSASAKTYIMICIVAMYKFTAKLCLQKTFF